MSNTIQWGDVESDYLVGQRLARNNEYHHIVGRSRVEFWRSISRGIYNRYGVYYTSAQCATRWGNLTRCYTVSKFKSI